MAKVNITIYKMTGWQLFFYVPEKVCVECDLSVATVKNLVKEFPRGAINLEIKKWFNNLPLILVKGGWHPPVITINGKIFFQGIVPNKEILRKSIQELLKK